MTEFLTLQEVAAKLKLRPQTIKNLMARKALKIGTHYFKRPGELGVRFDPEAVEKWVREGNAKSAKNDNLIPMARGYTLR